MTVTLYAHPFSSYCQKVLIALYENEIPFELRMLAPDDEKTAAEHAALWPLERMPVLVDGGRTVVESSIIIEHLGLRHPGPVRLIPDDPRVALDVRMMDRIFDPTSRHRCRGSCSTASVQQRTATARTSPRRGRCWIAPTAGSTTP
jgi:glutathione S-transferase